MQILGNIFSTECLQQGRTLSGQLHSLVIEQR